MKLRPYQQDVLDRLHTWWMEREGHPLLVLPTGSGKSVVIAELVRLLFDTYPEDHPRTVVIVPSRELAEQNAEKLRLLLPSNLSVGYYSASLGKKNPEADVIVATIGSIFQDAHLIGNIKCVIIDEAHLVSNKNQGRYRQFLTELSIYCRYRVMGCTATPFRGDGIWLTDGEDPFFSGVAATITMQQLLNSGHIAPLVRPIDVLVTQVDTGEIKTTGGDYNIGELETCVNNYIPDAAAESAKIAIDRKKWIAFLPTVANAEFFVDCLNKNGIKAALVCGETKKAERIALIGDFKKGEIQCLVTVLALATGFDVPDVDCVIWLRPTISPVLYIQGAGRGTRIADGKTDCLWLDFTTTTARLGAIDTIKGRKKRKKNNASDGDSPTKICDNCGESVAIKDKDCPSCGYVFPEDVIEQEAKVSTAAIMSYQVEREINEYVITSVDFSVHKKNGSPDSMRVDYYSGLVSVCSEWVCFEHGGFAGEKAKKWYARRSSNGSIASTAVEAVKNRENVKNPIKIKVDKTDKFPRIVSYLFDGMVLGKS